MQKCRRGIPGFVDRVCSRTGRERMSNSAPFRNGAHLENSIRLNNPPAWSSSSLYHHHYCHLHIIIIITCHSSFPWPCSSAWSCCHQLEGGQGGSVVERESDNWISCEMKLSSLLLWISLWLSYHYHHLVIDYAVLALPHQQVDGRRSSPEVQTADLAGGHNGVITSRQSRTITAPPWSFAFLAGWTNLAWKQYGENVRNCQATKKRQQ